LKRNLCVNQFVRLSVAALGVTLCLTTLVGCGVSAHEMGRQNDELRRSQMELQREVDQLREQVRLRESEVRSLQKQVSGGVTPVEGADVPTLAELRFARYSGPIDTNRDGVDDVVRLYLRPTDQHGRFLTVSGKAVIQVVAIRTGEAPLSLADVTIEPAEFDKAYRSGLTGTHYSLDAKLNQAPPVNTSAATAKVTFTVAATGVSHTAQTPIVFRAAP